MRAEGDDWRGIREARRRRTERQLGILEKDRVRPGWCEVQLASSGTGVEGGVWDGTDITVSFARLQWDQLRAVRD